ncbi:alpha/beta fold hydrolase [Baekduia soli]|uniref:Alpha/beta fold hydrolase n=1 Tax=Baekduia soli TaxID=496014 RepID=A0A5B8U9X6_9ACTN|nr:alpha/beta hydrolase [Baekduia soli]QEC49472.1 alpha/beta fold hydrolase [Baekduia soli]
MSYRLLHASIVLAAVLAVGVPSAAALDTGPCPGTTAFRCATVTVPLDRSGTVPGTIGLRVAVERPRDGADGFLLALSGGPGQPAVPFADSFRSSLAPALGRRRLVLVDQRGTGGSGLLVCRPLQALGTLDVVNTRTVERCARALGPSRQFYSTTDSVLDLEAVRAALGAPTVELMGVSYGTYVAAQYARRFPARTDGLILDSVVGPDGIDTYFLDTFERLPRVLAEQCARSRCRSATRDPLADLARVAARVARAPLRGTIPGLRGVPRATAVHSESELLLMIMSGDLNPFLQAALPGAIGAAARGDAAPLLRLRRIAEGPPSPASQFSAMLNVATTCADARLPYTFLTPYPDRWTAWRQGTAGVPDVAFAPFSRAGVIDTSLAHDCLRWPQGDTPAAPSADPLPDVPALLLSGRLDTRTPLENARELRALLPRAQLLTVAGTGHDVLDSDVTGCAARALRRFADGASIGTPCAGLSNAVAVLPRPARALGEYRSAPGVGGRRGRVLFAALDTVTDGQVGALQALYAGYRRLEGGGLRGGWYAASSSAVRLTLHADQLVPGVRVSGTVSAAGDRTQGVLRVDAAGTGADGLLRIGSRGVVTGTLGGRAVRYDPSTDPGTTARAGGRGPMRVALPALRPAARRAAALRARR